MFRKILGTQKTAPKGGFKNCAHQDLPSGKIPDGIFLQAGLAVLAFRSAQTKTTLRLSSPVTHQAVGAFGRKKTAPKGGFKNCAHQDLNLEPTDYESVALTN